jgi:hypothetical protein
MRDHVINNGRRSDAPGSFAHCAQRMVLQKRGSRLLPLVAIAARPGSGHARAP